MSAVIDNDYQTSLLFKRFTGVAATQLDAQFSNEPFRSVTNIFSRDINIEEIPSEAPISIATLDNSNNWVDSSFGAPSLNNGQSFADLYPDTHINFYKNVTLTAVPGSNSRVWRYIDSSGNNLLQDTINFKFDDVNSTYLMRVKYNNGNVYINNTINSFPLFWVMDNQSGYLQLYQTTALLASQANIPTSPPKLSFYKYIGKKGLTNLDISGQQQVADISGIDVKLNALNRMILPDGYVDISGTDYDLCGNEVVRTNYTYNRKNMYIGYENLPILDGSAVDHAGDPSFNNINDPPITLDVSGNTFLSGSLIQGFFDPPNITGYQGVSGEYSHAEGYRTWVGGDYAHAEGNACIIGPNQNNSGVAHFSHAEGDSNKIFCLFSHAEGRSNEIKGSSNWSHIEGHNNLIDSNSSYVHAEGRNNTVTSNSSYSHIEGSGNNIISAISSHAEGVRNTIKGLPGGLIIASHTEGLRNDISGNYSHAEGFNNKIGPNSAYCHIEGISNNIPFGTGAHVEGTGNLIEVTQFPAHIEGGFNRVGQLGAYSHAEGFGTIIDTSGGHATGHYNDLSKNVIFVVGCGKNNTTRMDALYVDLSCVTNINNELDVSGNITLVGDLSMNGGQIVFIGDATDNSGVPSWGQVQLAIEDLSNSIVSSYWTKSGTNIYYNTGNVGIGNTNPAYTLDVGGDANLSQNALVAQSPNLQTITVDKNLYTRNSNLIDTLKIGYDTFFRIIWEGMLQLNINLGNIGKPTANPTFASSYGPTLIPIAYIDINQVYNPTQPLDKRPYIANAMAYFTVKFAQPSIKTQTPSGNIIWDQSQTQNFKSFLGALPEQTIHFVAGYTENYLDPNRELRKPKPFIKIISTNIINQKCLTGITQIGGVSPADINLLTNGFTEYSQTSATTPKIGGLSRIIIAEGLPGVPAPKEIRNKVWLFLEQTWNHEPWQGSINKQTLSDMISDHIIDVKMYSNNTGELSRSRNPGAFPTNTDWQLVTEEQIITGSEFSWDKFILPMGANTQPPNIFNIPTDPTTEQKYTLQVGGTPVPDPPGYPVIYPTANLWEVWLKLKDWPYGITTTEEVFENNVDISGNVIIEGGLDALSSIDVGPNQKLTIIEDKITSTTAASGPFDGLKIEANNIYLKFNPWASAGGATPAGLTMDLGDNTSNTQFRIRDASGSKVFSVEGSGLMQTQNIYPFTNMTYNIGYKAPNPIQDLRYKNFYVGNIDSSGNLTVDGNVDISGNLTVDGNIDLNGNVVVQDLSATNIDVSNNLNVFGQSTVQDLSATNIDVSNNLNVEGLITGVAETTFVEYKDYIEDICSNIADWYCIARTKDTNTTTGGPDNARGLFIIDDNTSGIRQQIIFYAGTSYSRGNYINVIANNWYGSTPTITNLKLEVNTTYTGTNLYIYRRATAPTLDAVYARLYQNTRVSTTGGQWQLTATPIAGLTTTPVNLDLTYNPNNDRANAVSSLDTLLYGDFIVKSPSKTSNDVIDVDREAIGVNFGGYDYTGGTNIIGTPTPRNRVIVDLQAGSTQFGNNVADSGSVIQTLGGIKILPLQTNANGAPPNYAAPGWGSSLFLGEWGWGNQSWNNQTTVRFSQHTRGQNFPGSGNVYCNAVRQNVVYSALNTQGPTWTAGYQGYNSTMYYNTGDIRYIIVDPRQGSNNYATVTLPAIQTPMLGQAITVARTMVPDNFLNYDAGLLVKATTNDRINCPHSIFIDDNAFGGISIDPHNVMGNTPNPGFDLPTPYKGNEICSVTLVASQNGYFNTNSSGTSGGGQITTQFVWQFISSGSPGL